MNDAELEKKIIELADKIRLSGGSLNDFVYAVNQNPEMIAKIHRDNKANAQATRH